MQKAVVETEVVAGGGGEVADEGPKDEDPPKPSSSPAVLDALYFRFYEFFSVNGASPFRVKVQKDGGWFSAEGEGSSSTMTSPLLFEVLLTLRTLNRAWLSRFQVFTHIAPKSLTEFNLDFVGPNPTCFRSFSVELKFTGPPSKAEAAKAVASKHYHGFLDGAGMWDRVQDRVASTIARTGTCDLEQEFGLPDGPKGTLHYDEVLPQEQGLPTEPSPAARLATTPLGVRLLSSVETLQSANQVWESDTEQVWPQKHHNHVVRCFKFLALAIHDSYTRFVSISDEGGYSFEGMSSGGRKQDYYIERAAPTGQAYWIVVRYSSRVSVEM